MSRKLANAVRSLMIKGAVAFPANVGKVGIGSSRIGAQLQRHSDLFHGSSHTARSVIQLIPAAAAATSVWPDRSALPSTQNSRANPISIMATLGATALSRKRGSCSGVSTASELRALRQTVSVVRRSNRSRRWRRERT
jgi:hypothetical protein